MFLATSAFADESADINKLMKAGQLPEALTKIDASLAQRPRDPQLRFLKGLIFTEQNKTNEAIAIFTKLTEDFPELPEPYNNLAVLFASTNQYEKARASLEMAIRTNPTYATAHENLGDVYAKLASQAYDKALQLDSNNSAAKSKLTMVRTLVSTSPGGLNPKTLVATVPANTAPVKPLVAPTPVKPVTPTPIIIAKVEPVKVETPKVEPVKATPKPESKSDTDNADVLKAVNNWAQAWSNKDVRTYLNLYANDFQTPKGESRKIWSDERRARIEGKGRINVKVESPQVRIDGNAATVKFRQIYTSDRLTANSRKTLLLEKQGSQWQIKQESTGN